MVKYGASSHKTNYIDTCSEIPNHEGHVNCCIGAKVTVNKLNGWILPTGVVALGRVCPEAWAEGLFILELDKLIIKNSLVRLYLSINLAVSYALGRFL